MSVQDEREFRERLGGLLDGIEPAPAPVFRAMRQGRGIRMRRWVSTAAALAVLAAAAVGVPFFLHQEGHVSPSGSLHYSVTVNQPSRGWRRGLIASGTEDGHSWSLVLSGRGNGINVMDGMTENALGVPVLNGEQFALQAGWSDGNTQSFVAVVNPDVTQVRLSLNDGKTLTLVPVKYQGADYVGLKLPRLARITRGNAFHDAAELAYSVPYAGWDLANWWLPGQTPPARATKTLASGVSGGLAWNIAVQFGPWGYCSTTENSSGCADGARPPQFYPAHLDSLIGCQPWGIQAQKPYVLGSVVPGIAQVAVTVHGKTVQRYTPVIVGGIHLVLIFQPRGSWSVVGYNAAGQVVGTLTNLLCPPPVK